MEKKMSKKDKISAIAVYEKNENLKIPLIESYGRLKNTEIVPDEIIIIDISDAQQLRIDEYKNLPIFLINKKNYTYGMAKNIAIEIAKSHQAKWAHFVHSETILSPSTISAFSNLMEQGTEFIQGVNMLIGNDWFSKFYNKLLQEQRFIKSDGRFIKEEERYIKSEDGIITLRNNCLASIQALDKMGGFDPNFSDGLEDADLSYRNIGKSKIAFCSESIAWLDFKMKDIFMITEKNSKSINSFIRKHIGDLYQLEKKLLDDPEGCISPLSFQQLSSFCLFLMREDSLK